MKSFRQFMEEIAANHTGAAVAGTGGSDADPSLPLAKSLFKRKDRKNEKARKS